ncbi:Indoleamine 2,3-dioxygenase [Macrolepiota fuliginosa MF-IS2]|uniref:Indoleamine 2,3-dioxygenase n=1 Tax=Macrolepiota fuliginosa MF-IS2 TaxID=1400762 RepID=A0A9P5XFT6_9AGAR|nr:Indoleamine 2,3-dioxygenase [Macrolepiota fuliginosa MF-IS2]
MVSIHRMGSSHLINVTTPLIREGFSLNKQTGFVPPHQPLSRLPAAWEAWEANLDAAVSQKLQLAERVEAITDENKRTAEEAKAREWRNDVEKMPLLAIDNLNSSEEALRRAHHVLSILLHFYAHTVPSAESIIIPRSLTIPLLQVSSFLRHPPINTYSDNSLYNWAHREPRGEGVLPTIDNLRCQTIFSGTADEDEFHLTSTRIELRGGEALELLRLIVDEISAGDTGALERITGHLGRVAVVIQELREILLSLKKTVDPEVFYNEIRPWLTGADGDPWGRPWIFEGKDEVESWAEMSEVTGSTAGQSSLIQALDSYLGVEPDSGGGQSTYSSQPGKKSFQERVRSYMPYQHREYLERLRNNQHQLRALVRGVVAEEQDSLVVKAYDSAVKALKEFRDAHMIIVTLYVIGPARRAGKKSATVVADSQATPGATRKSGVGSSEETDTRLMEQAFGGNGESDDALKGTGGTDLVRFLKGIRDQTALAYLRNK